MEIIRMILIATGVFAVFYASAYLAAKTIGHIRRKRRRRGMTHEPAAEKRPALLKFGTMDVILIIIAVALVLFTLRMIDLYETTNGTPDTLITCVFAVCGGECGVMGWIKTSKDRRQDRRWQKEDERKMEEAAARMAAEHSDSNQ